MSLPDDDRFTRSCPECHSQLEEGDDDALYCPRGHAHITRSGGRMWEIYDMIAGERAALVVASASVGNVRWTPKYCEALEPVLRSHGAFARARRHARHGVAA